MTIRTVLFLKNSSSLKYSLYRPLIHCVAVHNINPVRGISHVIEGGLQGLGGIG